MRKKIGINTLMGQSTDRFLNSYWPEKSFHHHAAVSRIASVANDKTLLDVDHVLDAASRTTKKIPIRVWFQDQKIRQRQATVTSESAKALYASRKVTVVVDNVDRICTPIRDLMRQLCKELGVPQSAWGCNVYCSPKGEGTKMHFDQQEVILVQLKGKKQWKIAENTNVRYPSEAHFGGNLDPSLKQICKGKMPVKIPKKHQTVVLKPGSVLFLPRGHWHESKTMEDSLALTLTFASATWMDVIMDAVTSQLKLREDWRKPAFLGTSSSPKKNESVEKTMKARLQELQQLLDEIS